MAVGGKCWIHVAGRRPAEPGALHLLIAVQGLALLLVMVGVGKEALQHHGVGALQVVAMLLLLLLWVLLLV